MRLIPLSLIVAFALAAPAHAQGEQDARPTRPAAAQPRPAPMPAAPQPPRAPGDALDAETPPPAAAPARRPLPTENVRVEVTITDQTGSGAPTKKVVAIVVADGRGSGVRSTTDVPMVTTSATQNLILNVDANASITPARKVLIDLRFHYSSVAFVTPFGVKERPQPVSEAEKQLATPRPSLSGITENLSVLLTPGTPAVIARSADAATDRTVTVEVKAEILK